MSRLILDLCGGTGSWSKPYVEAGYDVRIIDPQVWLGGEGGTGDAFSNTMTYMKDPTDEPQVARSKARFERLSQKYPEFTFVLPEAAKEPPCL